MAVEIEELIPSLQAEVIPLGSTEFASVQKSAWVAALNNSFWEARLDGVISGDYSSDSEVITNTADSTVDLGRDIQQVMVYYAAEKILRNQIKSLNTRFLAEAGPNKYEVEKSAQVLTQILKDLVARRNQFIDNLSTSVGGVSYVEDLFATLNYSDNNYWVN